MEESNPIAEYLMNVWNRTYGEELVTSKKKAMDAVMELRRNSRPYEFPESSEILSLSDEELTIAATEWMRGKITDWFDPYKDLQLLPKPCQYVYSCQTVLNEVGNGGLVQLFFNSRREDAEASIEGFKALGVPNLSHTIMNALEQYKENKDLIEKYKAIPNGYVALCNEKLFDKLERLFLDEIGSVNIPSYIRVNIEHFGDKIEKQI